MSSDSLDLFEMVTSCLSEGAAFICPMVCVCVCVVSRCVHAASYRHVAGTTWTTASMTVGPWTDPTSTTWWSAVVRPQRSWIKDGEFKLLPHLLLVLLGFLGFLLCKHLKSKALMKYSWYTFSKGIFNLTMMFESFFAQTKMERGTT